MTLWLKVSDIITDEIRAGSFSAGEKLPASSRLADKYGVHQHTVLKALSHLEAEGVLRVEHGRGTFVSDRPVRFRLGAKSWFEQNVADSDYRPTRSVISVSQEFASSESAQGLGIASGDPVVAVILIGSANGTPIYIGRLYMLEDTLPGVYDMFVEFERSQSEHVVFTDLFARYGVDSLHRRDISIHCRQPEQIEVQRLRMSRNAAIMETVLTLADQNDRAIAYSLAAYCSDRVVLTF